MTDDDNLASGGALAQLRSSEVGLTDATYSGAQSAEVDTPITLATAATPVD